MEEEIKNSLQALKDGGIILYPTDTIWGIGCDATNEKAIERVYRIKNRIDRKSMLILLDKKEGLTRFVKQVPDVAWQLIEAAIKPLTIIYPDATNLPGNILGEDGSIGIRITQDEFCRKLISRLHRPIVSSSANLSAQPAPKTFRDVPREIIDGVDHVVSLRQDGQKAGTPSSVIKIGRNDEIIIIRE